MLPSFNPRLFQNILPEDHEIPDSLPSTRPYFDYERTRLFEQAVSTAVITSEIKRTAPGMVCEMHTGVG